MRNIARRSSSCSCGKEKKKAVSAHTFDIPPVPSGVSSYNVGSGPMLIPEPEAKSGVGKGQGLAHWSQCDLAVQCTDGMCQINMGSFLVLAIVPTCADTDSMRCVVLGPKGVKGQRWASFLEE